MLFHSFEFFLFFIVFYILYLLLRNEWKNRLLLMASYIFYASWDWRFLSLILTSTIVDYFCGIKIYESEGSKRKSLFLFISIFTNLSILGFFKYFNFFIYNLQFLLNFIGFSFEPHFFRIILPLGISFYTFKTLTYTLSVYWGQMKPTKKFWDYALFLAFFPALLSGPIDRAKSFLPQIASSREISLNKFYEGCYLIFWGLFQKLFIADNLAVVVDSVFSTAPPYQGAQVLLSTYAYMIQLYCDFAGYSNIAIGLGKILGFDMMINFNLPFFSANIAEFWRRWHISLSSWVRDYIFTPLFMHVKRVKGNPRLYISLIITMTLLGLWHGAAWNYIFYGIYYGFLLVIYEMIRPKILIHIKPKNSLGQKIWLVTRIIFMFHLHVIGFLLFRSQSFEQIYNMLYSLILNFNIFDISGDILKKIIFFSITLIILEILQYRKNNQMIVLNWSPFKKAVFYFMCFYLVMIFGVEGGKEFIYAQF